jgi:hypothetical protein
MMNPEDELFAQQQKIRDLANSPLSSRERQAELKKLGADYIDMLLERYDRIQLGIDGNAGYALLGPNLQAGVAYFMPVSRRKGESKQHARRRAAMQAYSQLLNKVSKSPKELAYYWEGT